MIWAETEWVFCREAKFAHEQEFKLFRSKRKNAKTRGERSEGKLWHSIFSQFFMLVCTMNRTGRWCAERDSRESWLWNRMRDDETVQGSVEGRVFRRNRMVPIEAGGRIRLVFRPCWRSQQGRRSWRQTSLPHWSYWIAAHRQKCATCACDSVVECKRCKHEQLKKLQYLPCPALPSPLLLAFLRFWTKQFELLLVLELRFTTLTQSLFKSFKSFPFPCKVKLHNSILFHFI